MLAPSPAACKVARVTAPASATVPANDAAAAEAAWRSIRESGDIQFAPVPPDPVPVTPDWLKALGRFLEWLLSPLGRLLGGSWSVIEMLMLVGAGLGVLWIAWSLLWPLWRERGTHRRVAEPEWAPLREEALALLEDADRLAAQGLSCSSAALARSPAPGPIGWPPPAPRAKSARSPDYPEKRAPPSAPSPAWSSAPAMPCGPLGQTNGARRAKPIRALPSRR